MRQSILTPGKAGLLMLGIGTAALMGVPGVGSYQPPSGALTGILMDPRGDGVGDATVALYHADDLALVEITHTDGHGRFAFQQAPWAYHLFARPEEQTGLLGSWALAREKSPSYGVELVAERGLQVSVSVIATDGEPVAGVEVRAYRAGDSPAVLVRAQTDAQGHASFLCPERAHLAVLGAADGWFNVWRFDEEVSEENHYEFQLQRGRELSGRVVDGDGRALGGMLVSSSMEGESHAWHGYARTSESGFFTVLVGPENARLRILDPELGHLPLEVDVEAQAPAFQSFTLTAGLPLEIESMDVGHDPVVSRVWIWSEEAGAWGWGGRTSADGLLEASVSEGFSLYSEPIFDPLHPTELWNRTHEPAHGPLELIHLTGSN